LRVRDEKVVLKMNNDALKLIFSSDNKSTISEQPIVNLVKETKSGVRKILPQDTVNKIKEILKDNHTMPPDIHKQQTKTQTEEEERQSNLQEESSTPIPKNIKKNTIRTKKPINPFLYTKWVPMIKETIHLSNLQQKQVTHKLTNGGGG